MSESEMKPDLKPLKEKDTPEDLGQSPLAPFADLLLWDGMEEKVKEMLARWDKEDKEKQATH